MNAFFLRDLARGKAIQNQAICRLQFCAADVTNGLTISRIIQFTSAMRAGHGPWTGAFIWATRPRNNGHYYTDVKPYSTAQSHFRIKTPNQMNTKEVSYRCSTVKQYFFFHSLKIMLHFTKKIIKRAVAHRQKWLGPCKHPCNQAFHFVRRYEEKDKAQIRRTKACVLLWTVVFFLLCNMKASIKLPETSQSVKNFRIECGTGPKPWITCSRANNCAHPVTCTKENKCRYA